MAIDRHEQEIENRVFGGNKEDYLIRCDHVYRNFSSQSLDDVIQSMAMIANGTCMAQDDYADADHVLIAIGLIRKYQGNEDIL